VDELRDASDPLTVQRLDMEFFLALVELSGNMVLGLFANAFQELYEVNGDHFLFLYEDAPFDLSLHEETLTAVLEGDSDRAYDAMREFADRALVGLADQVG
jgi:DNA-binding FadR family transcriptional regulator